MLEGGASVIVQARQIEFTREAWRRIIGSNAWQGETYVSHFR